jgi:2-oxoglutarate/2-oxoacid ferredoxin oxidoreductase subunit alpha
MSAEELEAGATSAAISTSTATASPTARCRARTPRGRFFTRGTTKNAYARYSEEGADYVENMERLLRKFETAKDAGAAAGAAPGRRSPRRTA